jgi:hypothetical protein
MPRTFTTVIDDTQCIGDSLDIINNNYEALDTSIIALSSKSSTPFTTNNPTTTIQLALDSSLNLTGNVRDNSITRQHLGLGNIIQIVDIPVTSSNGAIATGTTEYTFTELNASITPFFASSRILIQARLCIAAATAPIGLYIKKGANNFTAPAEVSFTDCLVVIPANVLPIPTYLQYVDTNVGSTTEVQYQFVAKRPGAGTVLGLNKNISGTNFKTTSSITLYEIKA